MAYSLIAHLSAGLGVNGGTSSGITTTGANLIVLVAAADVSTTLVSGDISDSKGNTYTRTTNTYGVSTVRIQTFFVFGPTVGASHTFTVTKTGGSVSIGVLAFSGAVTSPWDLEDGNALASAASIAPVTGITPNQANSVVVTGVGADTGSLSITTPSGFTQPDATIQAGAGQYGLAVAYQIQTSAAFTQPSWGTTPNSGLATHVTDFKAAAAGGGTTGKILVLGVG